MHKRWIRSISSSKKKTKKKTCNEFEEFWKNSYTQYIHGIPTVFYKSELSKKQRHDRLDPVLLYDDSTYNPATKVRFVCTSDTHNLTERFTKPVPYGDVLLHAGDFTQEGEMCQVEQFSEWLESLPHRIKIVIAGNHDLTLDAGRFPQNHIRDAFIGRLQRSCIYLEDSTAIINGIKIYGTPWIPEYNGKWGFELKREDECSAKWREIPSDTDILLSHTPPVGHGDRCADSSRAGCVNLLQQVQLRIKPQYQVFGHVQEDSGITTDGQTIFINAAMCNEKMKPVLDPVVFDMDKKSEEMLLVSSTSQWNALTNV
ncbi:UPF0046 protein C25E10.12-like [Bolinopsis microptera]|uniref:UPF0046 protein C25E10.12-like n=1 Tax=Bolinopsis microptera TaxID=2820187 RepID=UPI003079EE25